MYQGEYIPPTLTVDVVLFQIIANKLSVLLVRRAAEPFKDHWALPGVYNARGETTLDAMHQALSRKAGVDSRKISQVEQLYTFDTVARDPRGHAVSVSYMCLANDLTVANTDEQPTWFALDDLPELAFDHADIIRYAHERLKSKVTYTNIIFALLPREFTFRELQSAYEAILGRSLDKRNFHKKFLSFDFIRETGDMHQNGAHRPAKLYEFASRELQEIIQNY